MQRIDWGKPLRFGKLMANFYNLSAQRKAKGILRFAGKARVAVFGGRERSASAREMEKHETKSFDSQAI
jgi:hypothetical protein